MKVEVDVRVLRNIAALLSRKTYEPMELVAAVETFTYLEEILRDPDSPSDDKPDDMPEVCHTDT